MQSVVDRNVVMRRTTVFPWTELADSRFQPEEKWVFCLRCEVCLCRFILRSTFVWNVTCGADCSCQCEAESGMPEKHSNRLNKTKHWALEALDSASPCGLDLTRPVWTGPCAGHQWRTQEFCSVGGYNKFSWGRGQRERGSGGGSPLVRGSGGSCNLVQVISFHIVKFS